MPPRKPFFDQPFPCVRQTWNLVCDSAAWTLGGNHLAKSVMAGGEAAPSKQRPPSKKDSILSDDNEEYIPDEDDAGPLPPPQWNDIVKQCVGQYTAARQELKEGEILQFVCRLRWTG